MKEECLLHWLYILGPCLGKVYLFLKTLGLENQNEKEQKVIALSSFPVCYHALSCLYGFVRSRLYGRQAGSSGHLLKTKRQPS